MSREVIDFKENITKQVEKGTAYGCIFGFIRDAYNGDEVEKVKKILGKCGSFGGDGCVSHYKKVYNYYGFDNDTHSRYGL